MGSDAHLIVVGGPHDLAARAQARIDQLEQRWSRFRADSEISRLTRQAGTPVTVSADTVGLVQRATEAWRLSGGAFDPTVLGPMIRAGYDRSFDQLDLDGGAQPGHSLLGVGAADIRVDGFDVTLPAGTGFDPGGIGKGLAADLIAATLAGFDSYSVDCAGDLRIGGASALERLVLVRDPWDGGSVAELNVADGAVATSGITARAWRNASGRPGHHLIDPGRGTPAWTGVAQATALAPTALEAEVLAKAALLAGPAGGQARLVHGGVLVLDDGELIEVAAPRVEAAAA
jgi:FAD:protein FMN transferase